MIMRASNAISMLLQVLVVVCCLGIGHRCQGNFPLPAARSACERAISNDGLTIHNTILTTRVPRACGFLTSSHYWLVAKR